MLNLFVWASVVRWRNYHDLEINAVLYWDNRIQNKTEVSLKKRLHVVSEWRGEDRELPKKLLTMIHIYIFTYSVLRFSDAVCEKNESNRKRGEPTWFS